MRPPTGGRLTHSEPETSTPSGPSSPRTSSGHVPGRHSMAGEIRGLDELVAWLGRLSELGFTLREHDVFANDEHVCALSYMGTRRPGVVIEIPVTSVFHFRAGRQVERWMYPDDAAAWDAIFDG
jgi:ketosteroid isomerase-like protein